MDQDMMIESELRVNLSYEAKYKIIQRWLTSLIVKVFEKNVGYNYLKWKLQALLKPKGQMDVINLRDGYFITKFVFEDDIQNVLKGGPWFIVGHYLTIR